jgi:hypothetical protein
MVARARLNVTLYVHGLSCSILLTTCLLHVIKCTRPVKCFTVQSSESRTLTAPLGNWVNTWQSIQYWQQSLTDKLLDPAVIMEWVVRAATWPLYTPPPSRKEIRYPLYFDLARYLISKVHMMDIYRICSRNFRPRVFHEPSYCSFTSNLTTFSLIIDYWIDNGIYSAFI